MKSTPCAERSRWKICASRAPSSSIPTSVARFDPDAEHRIRRLEPAAETHELVGDLVRAQDEIDTARFDGVLRHVREPRRFGSLREREAPGVLDLANAERAIRIATREHDANRAVGIRGGERLEEDIHRRGPFASTRPRVSARCGHRAP